MTQTCAYHPDRSAVADCAQCHQPICETCAQTVAGKTVCTNCVESIRARVAAESPAAPTYSVTSSAPAAPPGVFRMLAGVALAVLAGALGVVVWVLAVTLLKGNDISIFAIGVGWLAGWGALKGCGRGGTAPAVIGGAAALCATVAGAYFLSGGHFGWFQWLCVAVGVYEGVIVPYRAGVGGRR